MNSTSASLLSAISLLDDYGAKEWNLRIVATGSALFFLGIRTQLGTKRRVEWDSLVHAIVTGFGSMVCAYLTFASGTKYNACEGPATGLHRVIPAITQGYAICDIIQGYHLLSHEGLGPEFLAHGFATLISTSLFNEYGVSHFLTPMLVLEGSTVILALLRADFLSRTMLIVMQAAFVLMFISCRLVLFPYMYFLAMSEGPGDCVPMHLFYMSFVFGAFFNGLNIFWFLKIIQKVNRKLTGQERAVCVERK